MGQCSPIINTTTMKKVTVTWTSKTEKGCFFGCMINKNGFFVKYTIECDEETFNTLAKGVEIEVPSDCLRN
jgi:hypothetical protein